MTEKTYIGTKVPKEKADELREYAWRNRTTTAELIRKGLDHVLKQPEKEQQEDWLK
jgi:hypothetical protein